MPPPANQVVAVAMYLAQMLPKKKHSFLRCRRVTATHGSQPLFLLDCLPLRELRYPAQASWRQAVSSEHSVGRGDGVRIIDPHSDSLAQSETTMEGPLCSRALNELG